MANSEYDKCFQQDPLKGGSKNEMLAYDANMEITLNSLVYSGVLVGQQEMLSGDTFYYLSPEKKHPDPWEQPKSLRIIHLERPTELHTGVTRTVEPQRPSGQEPSTDTGSGGWSS